MTNVISPTISIRAATTGDGPALARLAALDSSPVPFGPVMLAEVDGQPRAALSVSDDRVIGDPFVRTAELAELLRVHARAVAEREDRVARGFPRLRLAA
ncbi:MAG TPA: hypothetical protein VHF89_16720 [Solirubrobacteraceae bacterium]|nr:hypothetical protein [Solirubrobacteraceae bacterium]